LLLLASSPQALTLTEIAKSLHLNVATCQVILNSLAEDGFVVRSPKSLAYVLGPGIVRLGQAARSRLPVSGVVEQEIEALHARTGLGCTVLAEVQDQMVAISQAGRPEDFPVASVFLGPFPFTAPFGATIIAFRDADEIEKWMAGAAEVEQSLYLRRVLGTIRARGVNVSLMTYETQISMPQFGRLFNTIEQDKRLKDTVSDILRLLAVSGSRWYLEEELKSLKTFSVSMISAPIITEAMSMEMNVHVFRNNISKKELANIVTTIKETCARIENQARGHE
jgi:DNA-binding IclR family transcriptional regulator